MSADQTHHQELKDLLAQQRWDDAGALWLDLAEKYPEQSDLLLLLVKEFADVGQVALAAELASLLGATLKAAGKLHEWLYALKLQAAAKPVDKALRIELLQAYQQIYQADTRLKPILAASEMDQARTPLPAAIVRADTLLTLQVGTYCQQKSWGLGRIKSFDVTLNRIVVAFPHNPDHAMQLAYGAASLTPVSPEHIEVRKLTELEDLRHLAASDPTALVRIVLLSHNRTLSAERIESVLSGSVIPADQWKRWWDGAKKLLKRDPHLELPSKKGEPIVLRTAPVSQLDELLAAFRDAPSLQQKVGATRQLLKLVEEIDDPDLLLQEFQDGILDALGKMRAERQAERLEAALLIEELRAHQRTPPEVASTLLGELLAEIKHVHIVLEDLGGSVQKRAVAALKSAYPQRLLESINLVSVKVLDEMPELLPQATQRIEQLVRNQTASADLLYWMCRNRPLPWLDSLPSSLVLLAALNALESSSGRATKNLHHLLLDDQTLITDLLADAEPEVVRDVARQVLSCREFEELDRRSLMGRLVKEHPFVQEFLLTKTAKEQPLIVSRASFDRRRAELEEIIQKKIPQNSKEIGQARSYGDLRENFEFKAAKDMQKILMRRRAELENLLARAQPTDFTDVNTDSVQIGTSVSVTNLADGQQHTYHILGAWDGDPHRSIVSYPAALARSLLNKKTGDTVEANGETGTLQYLIDRIEKVPSEILGTL